MKSFRWRFSRALSAALALVLVLAVFSAAPASAAGTFAGGPDNDPPIYVLNDHTAYAVHYTASGLVPDQTYHVKARFTVDTFPSGSSNRGFTWNPMTGQWVQERETWSLFPTATADGSGTITSNAGWAFIKFGDETKSGSYHIMISLSSMEATGTGATLNSESPTPVTVLDARSEGAWFHNGTATGIKAATRAEVTAFDVTTTVFALSKTETNTVDDDSNGIVDDEDYGPVGKTGDWRLGVPSILITSPVDVFLNRVKKFDDVPAPAADTEIALGAADQSAPTSPTALAATPGVGKITLDWSAATDDSGVAQYRVYRWNDTLTGPFTPVHELIGQTAGTTYEDSSAELGTTTWFYEVRAVDTSGNVSARSDAASAAALVPTVSAVLSPSAPNGLNGWYTTTPTITLVGTDTDHLEYSWDAPGPPWTTYSDPFTGLEGEHTLYYRGSMGGVFSQTSSLVVKVDTKAPSSASLVTPTFASSASRNADFPVHWSATDPTPGSDALTYEVAARTPGYAWDYMETALTGDTFVGTVGRTFYFRVRARDAAGNVGAWSPLRYTVVPYDQNVARYGSGWGTSRSSSYWYGSVKTTKARNASASFTFRGGQYVSLIMSTGRGRGRARVYVDGRYIRTIDTWSSVGHSRVYFAVKSLSGSGLHTIRVVNVATPGRPRLDIDGFIVKR